MILKYCKKISLGLLFSLIIVSFSSCDRNEQSLPTPSHQDTINKVNEFVYNVLNGAYLWNDYIPAGIEPHNYSEPFSLFNDMYYPTLDHWSFITDDYVGLLNSLQGTRKEAGFKFRLAEHPESSTNIYLITEYVNQDGNAYSAGLRRGDLIIKINDQQITKNNIGSLINQDNLKLGLGDLVDGQITELNTSINTSKIEQSFTPILEHKVIDVSGTKVGYFVYEQFISEYETEMENALASIAAAGATELVLDLRFNPGGYVSTCALLAGIIVPSVNLDDVFLTYQFNDEFTEYYQNIAGGESKFTEYFRTSSVINLNLSRVFILTSDRSASASEGLINGLSPYMQVITIGKTTAGKYTGANLFNDEDDDILKKWGIYLITSKIANANGVSDYVNGIEPDYLVYDDYTTPLGDPSEQLLAKALSLITGIPTKSTALTMETSKQAGFLTDNWIDKGVSIINAN